MITTIGCFKLETEKSGRKEVDEVVQTKDGDLRRSMSVNGRPLTAKREHDVDEQIRRLTSDSNALRRSLKEQNEDAAHSQIAQDAAGGVDLPLWGASGRRNPITLHAKPPLSASHSRGSGLSGYARRPVGRQQTRKAN